jgi:NAD(P)H-flavin reductase
MIPILKNIEVAPNIFEMVVECPRFVKKILPGHFVIAMSKENGERILLTAADFDAEHGTLTPCAAPMRLSCHLVNPVYKIIQRD